MLPFEPNYHNIVDAAWNRTSRRLPLYEHNISPVVAAEITNKPLPDLLAGDLRDKQEFFHIYTAFCRDHGYDAVPFEGCVVELIQGGKGLCGIGDALISTSADLEAFPWSEIPERYFEKFDPFFQALGESLPPGMKAVAGVGNGVFETIQDVVPLTDLAFLEIDNPEVYTSLWHRVGDLLYTIWKRFLENYSDLYCVCRIGDDLGFKSSLLQKPETIQRYVIPHYRKIIELIHRYGKPFLLHSCGAIFSIMDDLISVAGIDAKHSNEDGIAPFSRWVDEYGDRIGNFGGVEMNVLCLSSEKEIEEYVLEVLRSVEGNPGIAIGSGNQIADYIPPAGFQAMVKTVREYRGD